MQIDNDDVSREIGPNDVDLHTAFSQLSVPTFKSNCYKLLVSQF